MGSYFGHINLTLLNRATILRADIDGENLNGIFIPFKYNSIVRREESAFIGLLFKEIQKFDVRGYSHKIRTSFTKQEEARLKSHGMFRKTVGYIRRCKYTSFYDEENKLKVNDLLSNNKEPDEPSKDYSFEVSVLSKIIDEYDFREDYSEQEAKDIEGKLRQFLKEVSNGK